MELNNAELFGMISAMTALMLLLGTPFMHKVGGGDCVVFVWGLVISVVLFAFAVALLVTTVIAP